MTPSINDTATDTVSATGTTIVPVAIAHTPFAEKFAIPRQPALAPAATAVIELLPPFDHPDAVNGLEGVSHIWLLFQFHQVKTEAKLKVRPPRLGGNRSVGVFASRSTHRPNGIGQSVVKLEKVEGHRLRVSGVDLLNGTPIIDIKPYVPYADAIAGARNDIAPQAPAAIRVEWEAEARHQAEEEARRLGEAVIDLTEQCLAQDPKPAYQNPDAGRRYGVQLWDINVTWHYPQPDTIRVLNISRCDIPAE
ncbi:MAG: tRNA (N6-threonylcarbamoyladenosine(37)-N6)-methyltransferase TrmO [Oceanospirillaceae bacterium]|nr:tRNA (N6-threonylcarbamoyladenosine(37)-N6)-methyltransferase TrmO [Oceanospirillaceae bacterium]MBT11965.1 tRNA (N6-threonylcarbamoyladenosine(37)-N6)-methyltransferase TrmO [Oceanospirillaceae bacterium]|tara:strand:+ start:87432 stop:88181 length:750 start_codon:yes stop_codon:yes gene_type:complete